MVLHRAHDCCKAESAVAECYPCSFPHHDLQDLRDLKTPASRVAPTTSESRITLSVTARVPAATPALESRRNHGAHTCPLLLLSEVQPETGEGGKEKEKKKPHTNKICLSPLVPFIVKA